MRFAFKIARRFLKSNPAQTLLIILGIAIGVSVQIFIGLLIQGLQTSLIDKTIGDSSQITITSESDDKKIESYDEILKSIKENIPEVINISVADDNSALLKYGDNSQSLLIRGFDIESADTIYGFIDGIDEGTYPKEKDEIILGIALKEEYGININDKITLVTTDGSTVELTVVGFFDLNVSSINKSWGITTLETTNSIFDTTGSVTSIEMQVDQDSVFLTGQISDEIMNNLNDTTLSITDWQTANEQLLSGLQGQSISSIMIQVFVLVSVVLGIASVLAITVMQKSRQIGILKAMGLKNSTASGVFLFEGLMLGVGGAILGIIIGLLLSLMFTKFALNADGTPVVELYISYSFMIGSGCVAIAASLIASLIPAVRSSKLNPIDIIRNN